MEPIKQRTFRRHSPATCWLCNTKKKATPEPTNSNHTFTQGDQVKIETYKNRLSGQTHIQRFYIDDDNNPIVKKLISYDDNRNILEYRRIDHTGQKQTSEMSNGEVHRAIAAAIKSCS